MTNNWFAVDRAGLARILERRGKGFLLTELIQNAWDEPDVTSVDVTVEKIPRQRQYRICVQDDAPEGFADLAHAYTLFADSAKKVDPEKRGRFNLGEKLVLALASQAMIVTTTGGWRFDHSGRSRLRRKTEAGSRIELDVPLTQAEATDLLEVAHSLIAAPGIDTTINGVLLHAPEVATEGKFTLPTEISGADGVLRPTRRKTRVRLYPASPGEGRLYEMGIPVVETGYEWHVDIAQKVPLNMDRDNVPPAYMRAIHHAMLELTAEDLDAESANSDWARAGAAHPDASDAAVKSSLKARFGDRAVSYDPSDPEANSIAVSRGYTIVHGGHLSGAEWANARRAGALEPAGKVCPSRPDKSDPDTRTLRAHELTVEHRALALLCGALARRLNVHLSLKVVFLRSPNASVLADYGHGQLRFNLSKFSDSHFQNGPSERDLALIIHEFGHQFSGNHLSSVYYDALCTLGARLARAVVDDPGLIAWERYIDLAQQDCNSSAA